MNRMLLGSIVVIAALLCGDTFGEAWPKLDYYASRCVLIVRVRQVGEFSEKDHASLELEVVDTWAGEFDPAEFSSVKDGHIVTHQHEHGMDLAKGQEAIVFYTRENQPVGKIANHSTAFPIDGGKITYAMTGNQDRREVMTVEVFKERIERARHVKS